MARRGPWQTATTAVAGWLFADLLAALVLILLGTGISQPHKPAPVASATIPPPKPAPPPSTTRVGVSVSPVTVEVSLPADVADVRNQLAGVRGRLLGHRAGIVLTFGAGDESTGPMLADRVNKLLRQAYPSVFDGAVMRDFFGPQPAGQSAGVEIYLFTSG
jgi:hypothetical protein